MFQTSLFPRFQWNASHSREKLQMIYICPSVLPSFLAAVLQELLHANSMLLTQKFLPPLPGDLTDISAKGHDRDERIGRLLTGAELRFPIADFGLSTFLTRWGFSWSQDVSGTNSFVSSIAFMSEPDSGIKRLEFTLSSASSIDVVLNLESTTLRPCSQFVACSSTLA